MDRKKANTSGLSMLEVNSGLLWFSYFSAAEEVVTSGRSDALEQVPELRPSADELWRQLLEFQRPLVVVEAGGVAR